MKKIEKTGKSKKLTVYSLVTLVAIVLLQSCGSVPVTGRKQLLLVSDDEVISLSLKQYQEYMNTAKVIKGTKDAEMVARVGQRLASAVESYLSNNGYATEIQKYKWEFSLVQDQSVNAFAMPGGKVVINSGLIPVAGDEASLAVVVGHEIAHVVAKHANERLSQQIALQYGGAIAGNILGGAAASELGQTVFGLGAQVGVMLPYARKQEYEADRLGVIFMAMAGYDPRVSVPFWQRMAESAGGGSNFEFLSTHPTDANRIKQLQSVVPEALKFYTGSTTNQPAASSTNKTSTNTSKDWTF